MCLFEKFWQKRLSITNLWSHKGRPKKPAFPPFRCQIFTISNFPRLNVDVFYKRPLAKNFFQTFYLLIVHLSPKIKVKSPKLKTFRIVARKFSRRGGGVWNFLYGTENLGEEVSDFFLKKPRANWRNFLIPTGFDPPPGYSPSLWVSTKFLFDYSHIKFPFCLIHTQYLSPFVLLHFSTSSDVTGAEW